MRIPIGEVPVIVHVERVLDERKFVRIVLAVHWEHVESIIEGNNLSVAGLELLVREELAAALRGCFASLPAVSGIYGG